MLNNQREDINILIKFLESTRDILERLTTIPNDYILKEFAKDQELRSLLLNAWKDVRQEIDKTIIELDSAKLKTWEKLSDVGLTGNQLHFKWKLFSRLEEKYRKSGTSRILRRLFGCINSFLGSLSSVFTRIDIVTEFKENIEQMLITYRRKPFNPGFDTDDDRQHRLL
jgi:hypothetical protein